MADLPNAGDSEVTPAASAIASGASSYANAALSATKQQVKASAGNIYAWTAYNPNVTVVYVQVFYLPSASVTVGTTAPSYILPLPPSGGLDTPLLIPLAAASGITVACTTTPTGSTAPGAAVVFSMGYA